MILTLIIPMMLSAQRMHHGDFGRGEGMFDLDLTETQQEQIDKIYTKFVKEQIKLRADMNLARIELEEIIHNDVTGKKLEDAIEKVTNYENQLFKARIHNRVEIRNLLTDEQKAQLEKNRRAGYGRRFWGRKGDGEGYERYKKFPGSAPGHPRYRERN